MDQDSTKSKEGSPSDKPEGLVDPRQYEPLHGKVGLIDGDIIAYRCAFAAEKTFYLAYEDLSGLIGKYETYRDVPKDVEKTNIWSRKEIGPVEFALQATKTTIEAIFTKTRAGSLQIFLSGKHNFRDEVAVSRPYKAGRETQGKPTHWRAVRDYLINQHGAIVTDGYEADDAIGIASTRDGKGAFICTTDKDLDQLPGLHYNWVRDEVYTVSRREADFNLYAQILSGDSTDNIPGIDGIGPIKARKALADCKSSNDLKRRVREMYQEAGLSEGYHLEQARLIYILRSEGDTWQGQ